MTTTLAENLLRAPAAELPRYRYLLTDLMTGQLLSEGRGLTVESYARRLSGSADCSATLLLNRDGYLESVGATAPRRTALWIVRNEQLVWGGIIWTRRYHSDTGLLSLTASTFESYYARRRIRTTLDFRGWGQHEIIRNLAHHAKIAPHGDIGVQIPPVADPGTIRDRTYFWHERATFWERMSQLSEVLGGPDFTIEPGWNASGRPEATLRVGTPLGARLPIGADFPGTIRNYSWPDDGGDSANFWSAIGEPAPGSEDDAPPQIRDASMPAEWAAGYPLLEDVSDHQGVTDANTLALYAAANVAAAAGDRVVPEFTVRLRPGQTMPGLGDYLAVRLSDPWRFPADPVTGAPGMQTTMRVLGWTVYLSAGEGETVSVVGTEVGA